MNGVLDEFADDADSEEHRLLGDPRFHAIIAEARQDYLDGKFTRLEDTDKESADPLYLNPALNLNHEP